MDKLIELAGMIGVDPMAAIVGGVAGAVAALILKAPELIHRAVLKTPTKLDDRIEARVKEILNERGS